MHLNIKLFLVLQGYERTYMYTVTGGPYHSIDILEQDHPEGLSRSIFAYNLHFINTETSKYLIIIF